MVGVGRGAQSGVLVKNAEALERFENVDTLVIDKTGTLTEGKPKVVAVRAFGGVAEDNLLRLAASLEHGSEQRCHTDRASDPSRRREARRCAQSAPLSSSTGRSPVTGVETFFRSSFASRCPSIRTSSSTGATTTPPEREHVLVAIRDAFDAASRQIEDIARDMRGQVKEHTAESHGRVAKLLAGNECGFIETADGGEIYFHRNAVLDGAYRRLRVGSEVRFVEEEAQRAHKRARFA